MKPTLAVVAAPVVRLWHARLANNKIVVIERNPFSGLGGKVMYTACGAASSE